MSPTFVVVGKIAAMFLVIGVGWIARRRRMVDGATTSILSQLTTDLALPALIFTQMLVTVDRRMLLDNWTLPVVAMGVIVLGQLIGWAGWRLFATRNQAPTFIFVVAITNWIYLPLPILQVLYGNPGVALLLLCNAGIQLLLWTMGVATLHQGRLDRRAMGNLVRNPGLLATITGIIVALLPARPDGWGIQIGLEALAMIGSLTIPLSLLVTGAQLGAIRPAGARRPTRALVGVSVLRLLVAPLLTLGLLALAVHLGWRIQTLPLTILFLISAMPVAISCSILTERFGQDTLLAAQSILYTTLASIVTVPALFALFIWALT